MVLLHTAKPQNEHEACSKRIYFKVEVIGVIGLSFASNCKQTGDDLQGADAAITALNIQPQYDHLTKSSASI